jgi:hypothetical protein
MFKDSGCKNYQTRATSNNNHQSQALKRIAYFYSI